ncbi:hypothetical protein AVEN_53191-1 [Araneus ventricosus]|uniref:Uncharacterized protein n=1 Tax=Araneus ventricosus TaxID=182803 RepID=A0A4Y2AAQ8_ARAVE|nr:hypothetical protein AVEN_53191-1 [Araneus ventricosus]
MHEKVMSLSLVFSVPFLKQHEGYFGTDLVNLNRCQMTRTAPELANPSPNFHITPAEGRSIHDRFNVHQAPYTENLQWNRVSNLDPSGLKAETLPQ